MKKIIFLNSHPIQYFAPLYAFCTRHDLPVNAWYCSDESVKGAIDVQFGREVKWDIPLLQGYNYSFFKNYSPKPGINGGFFGLINWGVIKALRKTPKSVIVIHGWNYFTNIVVLLLAGIFGHEVCLRCETPLNQEIKKSKLKLRLRKFVFKYLLFPRVNFFLYIGDQNRKFYQYYGVKDTKLIFTPYAVDNERFKISGESLIPDKVRLRRKFGLPEGAFIFLFCGKYIIKKRPLDAIKAFHKAGLKNAYLLMIGEGKLRQEMEDYINRHNLQDSIRLTGFINQSTITEYYALSDALVICSEEGETWGLVVNEAMNFGLPVIASDLTGCTNDLVLNGKNGYIFQTGNIDELRNCLSSLYTIDEKSKAGMKKASLGIVDHYSFTVIKDNLKKLAS